MPLHAYNKEMLKKTKQGDKNEFYKIIVYCLERLQRNKLLTKSYLPTDRLRTICHKVDQILMPGITSLLDAERAIRDDRNYPSIVRLLRYLEEAKEVYRDEVTELITPAGLSKLTRLGLIMLYLDERVEITTLGEIALPLLER
jgi:hypothetical protein